MACSTHIISDWTQDKIATFFLFLGGKIERYPCRFILVGICLTILCSLGLLQLEEENRGLYLWIPRNSDVWDNHLSSIDYFGFYPETLNLVVQATDDRNILTPNSMNTAFEALNTIYDINANLNNKDWHYTDFCQRSYPSSPYCLSDTLNIFGNPSYFNFNANEWQSNISSILSVINNPFGYPPINIYLGNMKYDNNNSSVNTISFANVLMITYFIGGTLNDEIYDAGYEFLYQYQTFWGNNYDSFNENVTMYYMTTRSFDDEIARVALDDIPIFIAALFVMLIYLMFTLGGNNGICQRPLLATSAIFVLLCSLGIGFGISCFIGIEFNTLNALVPYILLGVGVDDMIIIMDSYHIKNNEIAEALSHSGLSITVTSLCSVMAFSIGSMVDLPGIQAFCIYAAFSFLANYILQFLIFVPLLVLDTKRKTTTKRSSYCSCCSSEICDKINCSHVLSVTLIPCLSQRIFRWLMIFIFVLLNILSIYMLTQDVLDTSASTDNLVPDDSFILDYFNINNEAFPIGMPLDTDLVITNKDFSKQHVRENINNLLIAFENDSAVSGAVDSWLPDYEQFVFDIYNISDINNLNSSEFYQYLKIFASNRSDNVVNEKWKSEIIYDDYDNPTYIKVTRFKLNAFFSEDMIEIYQQRDRFMDIISSILGDSDTSYVYNTVFPFGYLASIISDLAAINMIYAGCGIFAILLFLMDLKICLFVTFIIAMIDIDLYGWMYIMDVPLDTVSCLQLVMAVGLTVDYVLHMVLQIYITEDNNIKIAFQNIGISVMKGAFTTFLGALCLVFSSSEAFRIFFKMFVGIILIAVCHGLLLAPSILAQFPWIVSDCHHNRKYKETLQEMNDENNNEYDTNTKQTEYHTFETDKI